MAKDQAQVIQFGLYGVERNLTSEAEAKEERKKHNARVYGGIKTLEIKELDFLLVVEMEIDTEVPDASFVDFLYDSRTGATLRLRPKNGSYKSLGIEGKRLGAVKKKVSGEIMNYYRKKGREAILPDFDIFISAEEARGFPPHIPEDLVDDIPNIT